MPDNYFANYLPLLIHFIIAGAVAGGMVTLSWLIGYRRPTALKMAAYECGMAPVGDAQARFSVKFYLVAISLGIRLPWKAQSMIGTKPPSI
jgi:NADH-quinone oxidoreductase subunit A